ncbi:MAG TPA: SET domain-containing protein [Pantanalinema sp.]
MIHPSTELRHIDDRIGYGVFATAFIPRGTVIWALDAFDRVLSPGEVLALPDLLRAQVEKYAYVDAAGDFILCWDFGRYMNHSCRPSSRSVGEAFEIAVRDIQPGEQLTCEYGTLNMTGDFACACGAPGCRGSVSATDLDSLWGEWDREAAQAFRWALAVPQPLLPYAKLSHADQVLADALREGRDVPLPSSRHYQAATPAGAQPPLGEGLWALGR